MTRRYDRWVTRAATGALATAIVWLAGCAAVSATLVAPDVRLASLSLQKASLGEQRFRVGLSVRNPNAIAIPIEQLRFSVRLAGGGILDGRSVAPFTVASGGAQIVEIDVDSDLVSSLSRLLALAQGPGSTISYDLDGIVELSRGLRRTLPINHRGEIGLSMSVR